MKSCRYLILVLLFSFEVHAKLLGESVTAISHTLPGDSDNTSLSLPGFQIHEFNDYYGNTDKLITGGSKGNLLLLGKHFSAKASFKGSYIQPIIRTRNDQHLLDKRIGVHAEQLDTSLNISYTHYKDQKSNGMAIKFTVGGGYVNTGNHGFVQLYRQVHHALGLGVDDDKFGPKIKEHFRYFSYGPTFIFPLAQTVNFIIGASVYNSRSFYEHLYEVGLLLGFGKQFGFSFKYQFIDQRRSEWWRLTDHRRQIVAGLRLFTYWTPSLMYVSPYVRGDRHAQVYLSPISFTFPF